MTLDRQPLLRPRPGRDQFLDPLAGLIDPLAVGGDLRGVGQDLLLDLAEGDSQFGEVFVLRQEQVSFLEAIVFELFDSFVALFVDGFELVEFLFLVVLSFYG